MNTPNTEIMAGSTEPHEPSAQARVIAVGRAGAEMAVALRQAGVPGLAFALVDGDAGAVRTAPFEEKLFVGARLTRGFGAGGDPEVAKAAADEELPALRLLCQGYDMVFVLAGLGGGSGTGIAPVVARVARDTGASVFAFVTLPFECEGSRRHQQALAGLHRLKTVADGVLCLPNEKMLLLANDRTTLMDAFRSSREHIRDAVLCLWGQLTRPGLLNISFADICSVLRGPNLESAFAQVEVQGPERAQLALEGLLAHPLLAKGETLRRAEAVLVNFSADGSLGMGETRRIMDELIRLSDGARVVVGASLNETAGETLKVTVIASTRQLVLHESREDPPAGRPPASMPAPIPLVMRDLPAAEAAVEAGPARTSRFLTPPAPELTPELTESLFGQQVGKGRGGRKKPQQSQLPFEVITKGRFEKCEPTVRRGNNLDQPTFLRRGITLN